MICPLGAETGYFIHGGVESAGSGIAPGHSDEDRGCRGGGGHSPDGAGEGGGNARRFGFRPNKREKNPNWPHLRFAPVMAKCVGRIKGAGLGGEADSTSSDLIGDIFQHSDDFCRTL